MSTFYIKLWDDRASFIPCTDGSGTVESSVWGIVVNATGVADTSQWLFIWDGTYPTPNHINAHGSEVWARHHAKHDRHYIAREGRDNTWFVWDCVSDHRVDID